MIGIDEAVQRAIKAKSQIYNNKRRCPDGQRDAELRNLYELALAAPDGASAEIGVKSGGSLLCWSCAREGRGQIYAIDDWSSKTEQKFRSNVARYAVDVQIITAKSWDAADLIDDELAFAFIDGNHGADIYKDVAAWPKKIKRGGLIVFHDYGVWKPAVMVKKAVDEWHAVAKWPALKQVGSTIAFQRPHDEN